MTLFKNGKETAIEKAQKRYYFASEQPTTEVAIHSTFRDDLYIVYSEIPAANRAVIIIYHNPLIRFVWLGGGVLVLGSIIAMVPNIITRRRIQADDRELSKELIEEESPPAD